MSVMRLLSMILLIGLGACASQSTHDATLASLCSDYDAAVAGLTSTQAAKVDQAAAMKVDANCNGSGSYGPKPRGSQMSQVRDATSKVVALGKS
jgi:hypothetical protein